MAAKNFAWISRAASMGSMMIRITSTEQIISAPKQRSSRILPGDKYLTRFYEDLF